MSLIGEAAVNVEYLYRCCRYEQFLFVDGVLVPRDLVALTPNQAGTLEAHLFGGATVTPFISTTASEDIAVRYAWLTSHGATIEKRHPVPIAKISVARLQGHVRFFDVRTDAGLDKFGVKNGQARHYASHSHEVTLRGTIPVSAHELIRLPCKRCGGGPCRSKNGFSDPPDAGATAAAASASAPPPGASGKPPFAK